MRIWQRSFWGVLLLLTHTQTTDLNHEPTDQNLTRENRETHSQLLNYTRISNNHTLTLSNNNNSDHLPLFTHPTNSSNEYERAVNSNEEIEQRLSPDNLMFDHEDNEETTDGNSILEAREIEEAADYGLRKMYDLVNVQEPELYTKGLWLQANSAAGRVAAFSAPVPLAQRLSRFGYATTQASSKILQQWLGGIEGRAGPILRLPSELRGSLRGTVLQRQCRVLTAPTPCRPASRRYRTADGSCNNLHRPRFGAALSPLQRFLSPRYVDGVQAVRGNLPSARMVSTTVHRPRHIESSSITLMLMQWGQLIDHDITSTPGARAFNGSTPRCCADGGRGHLPQQLLHPECLPISIPSDDPVMDRFSIRCMEFVRSAPVPREDCDFGHRQQMNQVTSYLDASTIYGSSASQSDTIRLFRGGLIRFGTPDPPNGGEPCKLGAVSSACLRPGDARASEQPALTALHITWIRRHNHLAGELEKLNPHWSDEKLYQEARRIVAAEVQHITYREFLPIIVGHEVTRLFDLELVHKGYYEGYDERVNPAPANSFSAAAYRFGHSLVQNSFIRSDKFHRPIFNNVSLHDEQSNAENIWSQGSVDRLILGLVNQPSQKRDEFISAELTNHLFQAPGTGPNGFGLDLAAINIQRGRDHGLPPYTAWRLPCGLSPIKNFTDLQRVMSIETAEKFRSLYVNVDDIDFYSAGLAERPVRGGIVGPTFACIIAQQFSNLRKGDRFWYENGNFESSFTPAQLQEIRKITLAQVLCNSLPDIETIQPFVFLSPDNLENRRKSCTNLIDFDLKPWAKRFEESNTFTLPIDKFFENGVENKESNSSSIEKNPKLDAQEDIFSFSMPSMKLTTNEKLNTEEIVTRTIFRREKRHITDKTMTDNLEHRKSDDNNSLTVTNSTRSNLENKILTDLNEISRSERKRKRLPGRNKKPKPSTQNPLEATTIIAGIKIKSKNMTKSDLKQMYYGPDHPEMYYPQHYAPTNEDVYIGTQRPTDNFMTYLFNNVRKTSTATTTSTTPKPDYQFHIQINYFYNSTTESYPRPTQTSSSRRPTYDYDRPTHQNDYNKQPSTYSKPYNRPKPYNVHETDYSYTNPGQYHNSYPNDKIDFGYGNNRFTTIKPSVLPSSPPITVIEIKPQDLYKPDSNRPNIYIVNDNLDSFTQKPSYDYNRYKPQTYETKPDTFIHKRPITGHVTKIDSKPIVVYEQPGSFNRFDHKQYGTEVMYDNEYLDHRRPTLHYRPDTSHFTVHDKLDFKNQFVKLTSAKKQTLTTSKPLDDDKKFIRISTVKGHTTQTDSLNPIFISVQNKESDDDLEMTYDDILEVYMTPEENSTLHKDSNKMKTLIEDESKTDTKKTIDDSCSTELPRPMNLFIEDDLLEL